MKGRTVGTFGTRRPSAWMREVLLLKMERYRLGFLFGGRREFISSPFFPLPLRIPHHFASGT